jgi:hypothetical protein
MYSQIEKRAYFLTLEGFHLSSLKRFFKIEKLCNSLQERNLNGEKDIRQLLYMNYGMTGRMGKMAQKIFLSLGFTQFHICSSD